MMYITTGLYSTVIVQFCVRADLILHVENFTTSSHETDLCCVMCGRIKTSFFKKVSVGCGCGGRNVEMSSLIAQSYNKSTFCSAEAYYMLITINWPKKSIALMDN